MTEETDWFPADIKPVHEGVYKTRHLTKKGEWNEGYSLYRVTPTKYDHTGWCWVEGDATRAAKQQLGSVQQKQWKGLTKP